MYKVMVVDDESLGRKAIGKMIGELGLEVEVTAEARHGEEALELIRADKPHIVVTDMNMPVMNGQRFLERLYREYAEIKVIVISGYSQFEYLKAALTYRACEYVLKPVSMDDLREAMLKAIGAVREFASRQQQLRSTQDALKLRREVFLQHVTGRRIANRSDIQRQAEELGVAAASEEYRLAVCMVRQFREISKTSYHGNADLFMFSIENILHEVLADRGPLVYKSDDRLRLCVVFPAAEYDGARVRAALEAYAQAVRETLNGAVAVGVSAVFSGLDRLPVAFLAAVGELKLRPFGGGALFPEGGAAAGEAELLASFDLKRLGQACAAGHVADIRKVLDEFARKVADRPETPIRVVHRELARIVELTATEMKGIALADPILFDPVFIEGVLDETELRLALERLTAAAEEFGKDRSVPESVRIVEEITHFLDERYFEDISLIDVATRSHMDPSYLSKLFKAVTGENFIEYLTRKRMEKACELLGDPDRKITEVSELTGYENARYFSQVFKKFTGRTPSEYRESLERGGG